MLPLPALAEELLANHGFWGKKSQFSRMQFLRGSLCSCSRQRSYTHAHTGNTKLSWKVKRDMNLEAKNGGKRIEEDASERYGVDLIKMYYRYEY